MKRGSCLCGKVSLRIGERVSKLGACHCSMCRQWGSGPFFALSCGKDELEIEGEEFVQSFDSSQWAQRCFCKECGSNLFYRLKEGKGYYLSAGLFDSLPDCQLEHQVFIDEKPDYYDFKQETPCMTGAQVFALYQEKEEG